MDTTANPTPGPSAAAIVAMGCFWGVEKLYRAHPGVRDVAVGYIGGHTPDPDYRSVCSGRTGHAEAVLVEYDPAVTSYDDLLRLFWENHDPTQGDRQGNDVGSRYRSALFVLDDAQEAAATSSRERFGRRLAEAGHPPVTTRIARATAADFHRAEEYHQRYLEKNPGGYCPIHATGVRCD